MTAELLDAKQELRVMPDNAELNRLVEYYPTYEWEHRIALLKGYFQGKNISELVDAKLKAKKINKASCSKQSLGGHSRWVKTKVKRTIIRILYLRYRLDQNLTQIKANQELLYKYHSEKKTVDGGQANIRTMTHSPVLDK